MLGEAEYYSTRLPKQALKQDFRSLWVSSVWSQLRMRIDEVNNSSFVELSAVVDIQTQRRQ